MKPYYNHTPSITLRWFVDGCCVADYLWFGYLSWCPFLAPCPRWWCHLLLSHLLVLISICRFLSTTCRLGCDLEFTKTSTPRTRSNRNQKTWVKRCKTKNQKHQRHSGEKTQRWRQKDEQCHPKCWLEPHHLVWTYFQNWAKRPNSYSGPGCTNAKARNLLFLSDLSPYVLSKNWNILLKAGSHCKPERPASQRIDMKKTREKRKEYLGTTWYKSTKSSAIYKNATTWYTTGQHG